MQTPLRQQGFTLLGLLVVVAVINIALGVAVTSWSIIDQRAKEAELIWRGEQYARALQCHRAETGGYPEELDDLLDSGCIRALYPEPMSRDGEWRLLRQSDVQDAGGAVAGGAAVLDAIDRELRGPQAFFGGGQAQIGGQAVGTAVGGPPGAGGAGGPPGAGQPGGFPTQGPPGAGQPGGFPTQGPPGAGQPGGFPTQGPPGAGQPGGFPTQGPPGAGQPGQQAPPGAGPDRSSPQGPPGAGPPGAGGGPGGPPGAGPPRNTSGPPGSAAGGRRSGGDVGQGFDAFRNDSLRQAFERFSALGQALETRLGGGDRIVGVACTSTRESLRTYKGETTYDAWWFLGQ